ncbi:protein kinase [Nocardioides sp.]|uniref:protein kinase family protein n=1 Tax=Nocardioides sp. TaxID=35761 RepID=UPI0035B46D15
MSTSMQAGDVLAERYRLDDLLAENGAGRFWRAHDLVLHRPVAVHILGADDERAEPLLEAARRAGPVINRRLLRVLDAEVADGRCYVVNEWGQGDSLDILLTREGPLAPRRAAWIVGEVADSIAEAHDAGLAHGRLTPENVLIDQHGQVRVIGFGVEAALAGLAPGRINVDEIDLAGLLYCALTGKWAGVSRSAVPPAPELHGAVLRPRRVRAGIPRPLDNLCDQVLNPHATAGAEPVHHSARDISDLLLGFVGDLTGTQVPIQGPRLPVTQPLRPEPAPTAMPDPEPVEEATAEGTAEGTAETPVDDAAQPEPPADPDATEVAPPPSTTDLPTEAGMPVFHEDDEVDWLRARSDKPAPPPPLAEPPPRPLFAPDPPEGEPVRRPRAGSKAASAGGGKDYWPWDSSQDSGVRPVSRDTGGWSSGSWNEDRWATGEGLDDTGDSVPGRSWIRLAMIVAVCLAVMVAAVAAYQLGLKPPTPGSDDEPTTTASPTASAEPTPFTGLSADDFDPQGSEPREENPDQVPNVVDGDPTTSWSTSSYLQNFGPGGLKTGVGVVVDLGATKGVRQVVVTTEGGQTSLAAYVTSDAPTGVSELTPVGTDSGSGELTISLDEAVSGRYVTVWLTLLPQVGNEFRGTIAEVQVLG